MSNETPKPLPVIAPPSQLAKESDRAPRPGFRAPANKNSKVQKTEKPKKK